MGCGCIPFYNKNANINSNINKNSLNNLKIAVKDIKEDNNNKLNLNPMHNKLNEKKVNINKSTLKKNILYRRDKKFYSKNEDYSEYYLLLGKDIEPLSIKTEIFISCKNLPKFSRSFGYFVLVEKRYGKFWSFFGRTEISRYTSSPSFIKSFIINYNFRDNKESQIFKFKVKNIEKDEKIVQLDSKEINLQNLFNSKNQEITENLKDKGQITIKLSQKKNISEYVQMRIGIKGARMTTNKIFCRIFRKTNNKNEMLPLYVTEEKDHINDKNENIFYWKLIEFDSDRLSKNQLISQLDINIIKFQIFEVEKKKKEKKLTEIDVNIDDLINGSEFNLPKVTDEYNYLVLDQIQKVHHYSFYSFLISGMYYSPYFFIDCTRSKFNLILSEKLGNKYSKKFISKYKNEIDNNEEVINRPWYDLNFQKNIQSQNIHKFNKQILKNINGKDNFDTNILLNNGDNYSNNISYENIKEKNEDKISNPFENKTKLSEDYFKYSNFLFNSLIQDQFILNIKNGCPVFLLGSRVPKENQIECYNFSYNRDILNPEISNYKEMHIMYNKLLSELYLSFPCIIKDSLDHFYKYVSNDNFTEEKQRYHAAFFILTNYMNDTNYLFDFLLEYNRLPFSIIIVSLGDEFKSEEFELKINEFIENNKKNESFRNNIIYINFNSINFNSNDYEKNINTFCKQIYYKLSKQFESFIKFTNIKPLDSNNLSNKNISNFLELRKNNAFKNYIVPKFLNKEKEKVINEIIDLGFRIELFEYVFDNKLPTFDKHFIISMMNNNRGKFEKIIANKKNENNIDIINTLKIERTEYFRFNEQMLIDERELYFGGNNEKETQANPESNDEKNEKVINNELCNFCKTYKINIIFQYCKHKYSCIYCLSKIKNKICPICKNKIEYFVKIYNI